MVAESGIHSQFSLNATSYQKYNIIQNEVVKKLVRDCNSDYKSIIDLGCGT